MRALGVWIVVLGMLAAATACRQSEPPDPKDPEPEVTASANPAAGADAHGIPWFQGTVDEAFARARQQNKPVFLYWGADWCPPCHQLKATVFSRPDFIEKARLFIPVYIDGDSPGAQKLGDEFDVTGYPSVVVLRADRTELARINGGMDLGQYAEVLDLVLGDVRPVSALLASLQKGGAALSPDDCRRLAYNGWDHTDLDAPELTAISLNLERAAQRCPAQAGVERARLLVFATDAALLAEEESLAEGKAPGERLSRLIGQVSAMLADVTRAVGAADALRGLGPEFFNAARRADPGSVGLLRQRWFAVMDAVAGDPRYSEADQLAAIAVKLRAAKALSPSGAVPQEFVAPARSRVEQALARKHGEYERAGVVNSALHVLSQLELDELAYSVVEQEMRTSKSPYYYMLELAALDEERGRTQEAITWLERAYRESKGPATRFQWGTEYVLGLLRMDPENDARIREATLLVLGEIDGPDRIYRRTRVRLERLDSALRSWNEEGEHTATLTAIRDRMDGICAKIPPGESARGICDAFLGRALAS